MTLNVCINVSIFLKMKNIIFLPAYLEQSSTCLTILWSQDGDSIVKDVSSTNNQQVVSELGQRGPKATWINIDGGARFHRNSIVCMHHIYVTAYITDVEWGKQVGVQALEKIKGRYADSLSKLEKVTCRGWKRKPFSFASERLQLLGGNDREADVSLTIE